MSRLYYQVKVELGAISLTDYLSWLGPHVEDMLRLPHFVRKYHRSSLTETDL